jgi:hypothetical protein
MIILILVTIVTTVFLERIWGSSQTVQWIEASNAAYYQAVGIIEEQLIATNVTKKTPWNITSVPKPASDYTGRYLDVLTGSNIMPATGSWNSPYNSNYNIIALGQPVQIVIPDSVDWNNVNFEFRVPQIGQAGSWIDNSLDGSWVILWTLGYSGASLYASGETSIFQWIHINSSTNSFSSFSGITNTGSLKSITAFYTESEYLWLNGAKCASYNCTLKLSMIRPVRTSSTYPRWTMDGRTLPFLEYRINFWTVTVPAQFMTLEATAYSYGFQRTRTVRIPQITTNTALDFAVLQ